MSDRLDEEAYNKLVSRLSATRDENCLNLRYLVDFRIKEIVSKIPRDSVVAIYDSYHEKVVAVLSKFSGVIVFDIMPDRFNVNWKHFELHPFQPFLEPGYHSKCCFNFLLTFL